MDAATQLIVADFSKIERRMFLWHQQFQMHEAAKIYQSGEHTTITFYSSGISVGRWASKRNKR